MTAPQLLPVKITQIAAEAKDVMLVELRDPQGRPLPPFTPGAHLEVRLSNGLVRHYSLCNDWRERDRYTIGVGLANPSRGGSRFFHESVRVGTPLTISAPRNNFRLEEAERYLFIAGGIGITPILAMIRWCAAHNKDWRLVYAARSRQRMGYYELLRSEWSSHVRFHFDDEQGGPLDVAEALCDLSAGEHIYCCGPNPLMLAVEAHTENRAPESVHFEWFTAKSEAHEEQVERSFTIILRRSGRRFEVPKGRSILEVLEDHAIEMPYGCREGLCGTCETALCAGEAEHRDSVLSQAARASNSSLMICISRAKSETLELDL